MSYQPKRPQLDPCPVEELLAIVAGKWKARILYLLSNDAHTFAELRRSLPGIKQQVLAAQLKALCGDGIVSQLRTFTGKSLHSLYSLTEEGETLIPVLKAVAAWGEQRLKAQNKEWKPPVTKCLVGHP
jgi:DNA-binding HxlR family transcriptional regulator